MPLPIAAMAGMGALGALSGGKKGKRDTVTNTNSTSTRDPWGPTKGPLNDIVDFAGGLFNNYWPAYPDAKPPKYHPSQQTKDFISGLSGVGDSPLFGNLSNFITEGLGSGGHLGGVMDMFKEGSPYRDQYNALTQLGTDELFRNSLPGFQGVFNQMWGDPTAGQQKSGGYLDQLLGTVSGQGGLGLTPGTGGYYQQIADYFLGEDGVGLDALFGRDPKGLMDAGGGRVYVATSLPGGGGGSGPDNPYFEKYSDALREEMMENYERGIVPQIDAEYQRAGRYGSGAYAMAQARANEEINEAIGQQQSGLLFNMFERQAALDAQSRAQTGAGTAAMMQARDARAAQERQQMQSALFSALGGLGGLEQFGIGTGMQGLGLLSGQEQFGLGLGMDALQGIAGLEQFGANFDLNALGQADQSFLNYLSGAGQTGQAMNQYDMGLLGAGGGLLGQQQSGLAQALQAQMGIDANQFNAHTAGWQNLFNHQQYEANLPYQMLQQYMGTILPIASQFGTQHTTGQNIQPGQGFLPGAIQGGIGGVMAGMGMGGKGGSGGGATASAPAYMPMPGLGGNTFSSMGWNPFMPSGGIFGGLPGLGGSWGTF